MKKLGFMFPLLALAACATTSPAPTFTPLDYSYLPPILLKVSQINVTNSYVPTPSQAQTAAQDPAPPADTLMAMLNQRLRAAGQPGTGTVTVQTAYVDDVNGTLVGQMTVDVNLASADGRSTGFTEASVTATQTAPDSGDAGDMQAALYGLTKRLMTRMNVQLQYQIQKNLPQWVSWTNGGAAAASTDSSLSGVQATSLAAPSGVATVSGAAAQAASTVSAASAAAASAAPVAAPVTSGQSSGNVDNAVPNYLPGAGPAALSAGQN